jgi:aspartate aminotransferase-like enzyme
MPIEVDRLGIDVAVSASQKGWMSPPGVAFVSISPLAWELNAEARSPRYYFDWQAAQKQAQSGSTPWTPAMSVLFGVQEGLHMLEEEGLSEVYARHRRLATAVAGGLQALGFVLFAAEGYRSPTVTSALPMPGLEVSPYRRLLRERYGVVIAGGQGKMTGKLLRVGHLGAVSEGDVVQVLWAMERALEELDVAPADGRAVAAASAFLAEEATATAAV